MDQFRYLALCCMSGWMACLLFGGCASIVHRAQSPCNCNAAVYSHVHPTVASETSRPIDVERGKPRPVVDTIGWVVGIPSKVVLLNPRADNHDVREQTENELVEYMDINGLHDTKVRINQYDPFGEWRRLGQNKNLAGGWRYTFGALHTLGYTLFPGRIWGRDSYNPYTNSVHIYSDIPSLAIEQAAYAKDVHLRHNPGLYAAVQNLPFVGLWHEGIAKREVQEYYSVVGTPQQQLEASRTMHPQFGSEIGEELDDAILVGDAFPIFRVSGAAIGHVVGAVKQPEK